jgi:hypothetical protein
MIVAVKKEVARKQWGEVPLGMTEPRSRLARSARLPHLKTQLQHITV